MNNRFSVTTPVYEGPFELLLALVEKKKLHIHDITLAAVAEDFIEYLNTNTRIALDEIGEFSVTAATLLLIKSRALLPQLDVSLEEVHSMNELEMRLKVYTLISQARDTLSFTFRMALPISSLRALIVPKGKPKDLNQENLVQALGTIGKRHKEVAAPQARVVKKISLEEVVARLERTLSGGALRFSALKNATRHDVVVSFLALLELVKRGVLEAHQSDDGEIHMEHAGSGVPRVGYTG